MLWTPGWPPSLREGKSNTDNFRMFSRICNPYIEGAGELPRGVFSSMRVG